MQLKIKPRIKDNLSIRLLFGALNASMEAISIMLCNGFPNKKENVRFQIVNVNVLFEQNDSICCAI